MLSSSCKQSARQILMINVCVIIVSFVFPNKTFAQDIIFPDTLFQNALVELGVDTNEDGIIQIAEAEATTSITLIDQDIWNLGGIQRFINLEYLKINNLDNILQIDLQPMSKLQRILLFRNHSLQDVIFPDSSVIKVIHIDDWSFSSNAEIEITNHPLLDTLIIEDLYQENLNISNCPLLRYLDLNHSNLASLNLVDSPNIEFLNLSYNRLETFDVSSLLKLIELDLNYNELNEIVIPENNVLQILKLSSNNLTSFVHPPMIHLEELELDNNELSNFNTPGLPMLKVLDLSRNQLPEINVASMTQLVELDLRTNSIQNIDVTTLSELYDLDISENNFLEIDLNQNSKLRHLDIDENPIERLQVVPKLNRITIGKALKHLDIVNDDGIDFFRIEGSSSTTNLRSICLDEADIAKVVSVLTNSFLLDQVSLFPDCNVPSELGGFNHFLFGTVLLNIDGECQELPGVVNSLRFRVEDTPTTSYDLIPIAGSEYLVRTNTGTLFPKIPNTELFEIDPPFVEINNDSPNPFKQDFCLTAIDSTLEDVSIFIIPPAEARPGFEADYRISFRNRGTTVSSGRVDFTYDPSVLSFVSSDEEIELTDGRISLHYENLIPFQFRAFNVTFKLNSPMDEPPLNGGDILNFTGKISPDREDIRPSDNTKTIKQEIVNSYDPNDKTCLDGDVVLDTLLGQFLTYRIRFENTGTAEAINIAVEDKIDTTVFDISTLTILEASHPMQAIIRNNKVSFLFEEIFLPFDDANNDGFIIFEIKTKDGLPLGTVLENTADIFFDFNFPIITNTTETEVVTDADGDGFHNLEDCDDGNIDIYPGAPEIVGNDIDEDCDGEILSSTESLETVMFDLFPNPANDQVFIQSHIDKNFRVQISNLNGQVLFNDLNPTQINLSDFSEGIFLIKFTEEKSGQVQIEKIVKSGF